MKSSQRTQKLGPEDKLENQPFSVGDLGMKERGQPLVAWLDVAFGISFQLCPEARE